MKQSIVHIEEQHNKYDSSPKGGIIRALFSILKSKHNIPKHGLLNAVEVKALIHSEEWLELYPFYLFDGIIKGTVECKYDVPIIKKLVRAYFKTEWLSDLWEMEEKYKDVISTIERRWYILDSEIKKLKKVKFKVITQDIPAIFVIAPRNKKTEGWDVDPIILIKYGEDSYYRVHTWQ